MYEPIHVDGDQSRRVFVYALSTCGWCKKTKALLDEIGVAYDYIDVDTLGSEDSTQVKAEIMKHNPSCSFPTTLIDGNVCIIGFQEEKIRSALKK